MQAVRLLTLRLRTSTPTATAPCSGTPVGRRSLTASLYCAVGHRSEHLQAHVGHPDPERQPSHGVAKGGIWPGTK